MVALLCAPIGCPFWMACADWFAAQRSKRGYTSHTCHSGTAVQLWAKWRAAQPRCVEEEADVRARRRRVWRPRDGAGRAPRHDAVRRNPQRGRVVAAAAKRNSSQPNSLPIRHRLHAHLHRLRSIVTTAAAPSHPNALLLPRLPRRPVAPNSVLSIPRPSRRPSFQTALQSLLRRLASLARRPEPPLARVSHPAGNAATYARSS